MYECVKKPMLVRDPCHIFILSEHYFNSVQNSIQPTYRKYKANYM